MKIVFEGPKIKDFATLVIIISCLTVERPVDVSGLNREKETVVQQVVSRSTAVHAVMTTNGTSFAVPAVPNTTTVDATVQGSADSTAVVYTDIILKKTGVKRACSDPGYQFNHR